MKKLSMILLIAASAFVLCGVDAGKCMADPGSSGQPFQTLFFAGTESCSLCHSEESSTWAEGAHANSQTDVATELAGSHAGETPQEVAQSENCIACHAPTAVLANGGMSEAKALSYFFTTQQGKFTAGTSPQRDSQWPGVGCADCHDPHSAKGPAYFNSATKKYESFDNTNKLCGQCHGNLRFPDTDHLSYNIEKGTGGVGVPDQQTMPGVMCTDCHMYTNKQDGSNSTKYAGHSFAVMINEADGTTSTSCTNCHATLDAAASSKNIDQWKSEFQTLDAQAQDLVGKAQTALTGINDPTLQNKLDEAQKNLSYAESDESGGFHNHKFLMALLNDATTRAQEILKQVGTKS
jgi:formate-dependent nitrite reductase cytochrome c552 subunit